MPNFERRFDDFRTPDMIEQGGLINISGSFLLDHEDEVLNLVKHEGKMAEEKNPLHKVSKIEKKDGAFVVQVSDHNLALHIGKRLEHAYKGEHRFNFLKGEKFVEVHWQRND